MPLHIPLMFYVLLTSVGSELAFIQEFSEIYSLHVAISSSRTIWSTAFFPSLKGLGYRHQFISGSPSTPDLCLWLRPLRISCSDSSKFYSEAVLSYTALPLKRSVWLFCFGFLLFGVSHIFILSFQYSWPVSIVGVIYSSERGHKQKLENMAPAS